MKKQKLQKLMLAGVACGMAIAAEANAHSANQGETILLAGGGCGHNGGGGCGGHASNDNATRKSNGCSSPTRDNQIAAEDQGMIRNSNGCSAASSNTCNGRVRQYDTNTKSPSTNPQNY